MQTVVTTKYYGPTNTRGPRVKVSTRNGSKFLPFDYSASFAFGVSAEVLASTVSDLLSADADDPLSGVNAAYTVDPGDIVGCGGPDPDRTYWVVPYDHAA